MKINLEYELEIKNFFIKNILFIKKQSKKIKKIYETIPLEAEDLVSFAYLKLLESKNKLEYFSIKLEKGNIDIFFRKKIISYMWNYCHSYTNKKHQILNNIMNNNFESNEIILNNKEENYFHEELFSFLNKDEFDIMYEIYINKRKRKDLFKKFNISKNKLKKIEDSARNKICKNYDILI